jgi:hypothetical protein
MKLVSILILFLMVIAGCTQSSNTPLTKGSFTFTDEVPFPSAKGQGGQPALVTLNGVIISKSGEIDSHFKLDQIGGKDIKDKQVEVDKSNLATSRELTEADTELIAKIPPDFFISIGCFEHEVDLSQFTEGKASLDQTQRETNLSGMMIMADTVLVCGHVKSRAYGLRIVAKTVLLADVDLSDEYFVAKLSLTTQKLVLMGNSTFSSQGKVLGFVPMAGPEVAIKVSTAVSGTGTLTIHDVGASAEKPN